MRQNHRIGSHTLVLTPCRLSMPDEYRLSLDLEGLYNRLMKEDQSVESGECFGNAKNVGSWSHLWKSSIDLGKPNVQLQNARISFALLMVSVS